MNLYYCLQPKDFVPSVYDNRLTIFSHSERPLTKIQVINLLYSWFLAGFFNSPMAFCLMLLNIIPNFLFYVLDRSGNVVGTCTISLRAIDTTASTSPTPVHQIDWFWVSQSYRSKNIGSSLLNHAITTYHNAGHQCLYVITQSSRQQASHLFLKAGFKRFYPS